MPDPKYFWQVEMPDGNVLEVKDKVARDAIAGGVNYIGKLYVDGTTYEHLYDGATTNPIDIVDATVTGGHRSVTAIAGNLVIDEDEHGSSEFIFDGTTWSHFGTEGLKAFAFVDTGTVTVDTISYGNPTPNHTSTAATVNITENASGNLAISGTFTQPTISGSVAVTGTSSHNTSSEDYPITATTTIPSGKTKNYTPSGTISTPVISVDSAGSTTTIKNPTKKTVVTSVSTSNPGSTAATGEVTYMSYDSTSETLSFKKFAVATGDSITTSNVTVKNGDASYVSTQPAFTGTDVYMDVKNVQVTAGSGSVSASGNIEATATGGAYTPKKYQLGVNYDKTTSVSQGTATSGTATKTVYPAST